jgi:S-adenosylmethionine synthetase
VIAGEVTAQNTVDYAEIVRRVYAQVGYDDELEIVVRIVRQSPDIAQGVDTGGAGDQGIMYGFATNETPEFLPKGVVLAHALTRCLELLRRNGKFPWLRPDGKAQVTIRGEKVVTVLVSAQHDEIVSQPEIKPALVEKLIKPRISDVNTIEILVNPTGKFVQGGFAADTGLTDRKIMVDTYGGLIPHGGGCFSGKDPSKVDRSGAYMARHVAKNIVAAGLAERCEVQVSYVIGRAEPTSAHVNSFGTGKVSDEKLAEAVLKTFDFRPGKIIQYLDLLRPIYRQTAAYGHFGREGVPWEKTDRVDELREKLGNV